MKTKNFKKKLRLNKKTIADFKIAELKGIHGGIDDPRVKTVIHEYCPDTDGCGTTGGPPCNTC
ncbi:MAG: hypothetical protein GTO45_07915 [Candidatus Aminicenantes bacterium]|nr:hypothetical protein [Candidatus Aminicenantes bacterium]NIM78756.1 hypothetical protein [Candidatus Aminicenantes bacterium]NIN18011.1 hypothetical protein [Candidatus Aminicenantes bacterium]NIN41911.1 hypothetical protein [Candidatus Aminicenantes bacterium]NIN84666.1 hypothetical protein [Candidatus Aminicenantes bacterium]